MTSRPVLRTERLTLRPFTLDDAPAVQELASAYEIALNTLSIPHPYPEGAAVEWIAKHEEDFAEERIIHFAVDNGERVVGTVGLILKGDAIAELGYWIGVPFWSRGYTTEAAEAVLRWGFEEKKLRRIYAAYVTRNPASGRVMEKLGMKYEGTLRQHLVKWGEYCDLTFYGMLAEEWIARV